jgi:hypothetical protein
VSISHLQWHSSSPCVISSDILRLCVLSHVQWHSSPACVWLYPAGRVYISYLISSDILRLRVLYLVIFFASVCYLMYSNILRLRVYDYTRQAMSVSHISSPVIFSSSVCMIIPGRPCLYLISHLQWYSPTRQAVSMSLCFVINEQFWEPVIFLYKSNSSFFYITKRCRKYEHTWTGYVRSMEIIRPPVF